MTISKSLSRQWIITGSVLVVVYTGLYVVADCLQFHIRKDERFFWPIVEQFAAQFPPRIQLLRDYDSPTTPLLFILLGAVKHFTGGGVVLARAICLVFSFIIAILVAAPRRDSWLRPALAAAGLMACPYFLGTSIHVYTDVLASLLGLLGFYLFVRHRHLSAAIVFALAISTRQYMVAFPLAVILAKVANMVRVNTPRSRFAALREWGACGFYALSAGTLLFWFTLFGGSAPPTSRLTHLSVDAAGQWHIDHSLYFLSCIGAYFVLVEMILFRSLVQFRSPPRAAVGIIIAGVAVFFVLWSPRGNDPNTGVEAMGYLDKSLRMVLPEAGRVFALAILSSLCLIRFLREPLLMSLISIQALTLVRSHIAWDKYALPVLVTLWYFRAERSSEADIDVGTIVV